MNTDARISVSLPGHPKTKKLHRRVGDAGCWRLICLWLWIAQNKPDGDLSGMSDEDIEIAADWVGEPDAFVRARVDVRFLDGEPGARRAHDWSEHNPWASGADLRSAKASWNAVKRHHGEAEADKRVPEWAAARNAASTGVDAASTATSTATGCKAGAGSNAPAGSAALPGFADSSAPSPSPSPSPNPSPNPSPPARYADDFLAVWNAKPAREGGDDKARAAKNFIAAVAAGPSPAEMLAGMTRYAAFCAHSKRTGTQYAMRCANFISLEHDPPYWLQDWTFTANADEALQAKLNRGAAAPDARSPDERRDYRDIPNDFWNAGQAVGARSAGDADHVEG